LIGAFSGAILTPVPPPLKTPEELAAWANCDPEKISEWEAGRFQYKHVTNAWEPGVVCMTRGFGDCKCFATISREALGFCPDKNPRIVIVNDGRHAVVKFTDRRGEIKTLDNGYIK